MLQHPKTSTRTRGFGAAWPLARGYQRRIGGRGGAPELEVVRGVGDRDGSRRHARRLEVDLEEGAHVREAVGAAAPEGQAEDFVVADGAVVAGHVAGDGIDFDDAVGV